MADRDWVPMPSGVWDEQPCSALAEDGVDAVVALNMLRDCIPLLVRELDQVHQALPKMLVEVLTGDVSPVRWRALAALFDEPTQILAGLARLCRDQAGPERKQVEEGRRDG